MAQLNKIIISLDPEFKSLLRSIDKSLDQIAKNGRRPSATLRNSTRPQPASDEDPQEEGR